MTLWFDVTDLKHWQLPHLTGIQRTVVNVLAELLVQRDDIRLFAYNWHTGSLEEADAAILPPVVQRHLHGLEIAPPSYSPQTSHSASTGSAEEPSRHSEGDEGAPISSVKALQPRVPWDARLASRLRKGAVAVLDRCGDEDIRAALEHFLRGGRRLLRPLYRGITAHKPNPELSMPSLCPPPPTPPPTLPSRPTVSNFNGGRLLFQPGDISISLSATWCLPGYHEAIAHNNQNGSVKCINLIYDLIPTLYPQWLPPGVTRHVTLWARRQIHNADVLLTISEFQKEEIERYLTEERLPARPVKVVRLGDNPPVAVELGKRAALALPRYRPKRDFVLCVSTIDVRKNHHCLYHVWRRLAQGLGDDCPQLLLIGLVGQLVNDLLYQIRNDRLVNRLIINLNGVTDEELAWYYQNCLFTIYPSTYEGWGLPVSESLAAGKYCIAGNAASLPEAGGALVDYFDPMEYPACHRLVHRAVTDPDYVRQREEQIRINYKPTTWRMTAAQIASIADGLVRPSKPAAALPERVTLQQLSTSVDSIGGRRAG